MYNNIKEAIKEETKIKTVSLWGDEITFKPLIISEILGDGKQLIQIGAIDFRPLYYLVRIDSNTDLGSDTFDSDEITLLIENEVVILTDEELDSDKTNLELYPSTRLDGVWYESIFNER